MKHVPERSCIGCGEKKQKSSLIRIVRIRENTSANDARDAAGFMLDRTGRMNGRGAYLCDNAECLALAAKRHSLERSFHCRISPEIYEALTEAVRET